MLRRITWLIPLLAVLTLSGCIIFPTAAGMATTTATALLDPATTIDSATLPGRQTT